MWGDKYFKLILKAKLKREIVKNKKKKSRGRVETRNRVALRPITEVKGTVSREQREQRREGTC